MKLHLNISRISLIMLYENDIQTRLCSVNSGIENPRMIILYQVCHCDLSVFISLIPWY